MLKDAEEISKKSNEFFIKRVKQVIDFAEEVESYFVLERPFLPKAHQEYICGFLFAKIIAQGSLNNENNVEEVMNQLKNYRNSSIFGTRVYQEQGKADFYNKIFFLSTSENAELGQEYTIDELLKDFRSTAEEETRTYSPSK